MLHRAELHVCSPMKDFSAPLHLVEPDFIYQGTRTHAGKLCSSKGEYHPELSVTECPPRCTRWSTKITSEQDTAGQVTSLISLKCIV